MNICQCKCHGNKESDKVSCVHCTVLNAPAKSLIFEAKVRELIKWSL